MRTVRSVERSMGLESRSNPKTGVVVAVCVARRRTGLEHLRVPYLEKVLCEH